MAEDSIEYKVWLEMMNEIEKKYNMLVDMGAKPQEARSILPNSLKTEIIMTMNLREWRHFFKLRTSLRAHPQMREIAIIIWKNLRKKYPYFLMILLLDNLGIL